MKKILWYIGISLAISLCAYYVLGWSFWKVLLALGLAYGLATLYGRHPRIAKYAAGLIVLIVTINWVWGWFASSFPLAYHILPDISKGHQARLATAMDPGLSQSRARLVYEIQQKDLALEKEIHLLMAANDVAGMSNAVQRLIELRRNVNQLLALMDQARVAPVATNITTIVTSVVASLNKGERKGTIVHPNRTIVHFESDKAFVLLERSGTRPDGSYVLTPIDMPTGKSQRYFEWGGTPTVEGLFDGTRVAVSY